MVYEWSKKLQSWLFPPTCLLCGAPGLAYRDLCLGCYRDLPRNDNACRRCALPITGGTLCGQCQRSPPFFDHALAPLRYQTPVDFLIQGLKFHRQLVVARLLGELLAEVLEHVSPPEFIIPIPLHRQRLRQRGFNQALELARPVARQLHIPLLSNHVRRTRPTPAQSTLDLKTRQANVREAFALNSAIPGRHVAIVDDVMTTGSTVNELSRLLRRAGVEKIQVWACARTPPY